MAIKQHEPISSDPGLMSEAKRKFWAQAWPSPSAAVSMRVGQPRLAVLHHAMNVVPRPTSPGESVALGYMSNNKFHDREPALVRQMIESLDPGFFDGYPRAQSTVCDDKFKEAAIGEAARAFYRHGLAAYGKPELRAKSSSEPLSGM